MIPENQDHNPNPKIGAAPPSMPAVADPNAYEPTHDLLYTRDVRGRIVQGLSGTGIPSDPKALQALLSTLKDIDSAALGQMRIKSDAKQQDLQAEQQALVREMLAKMSGTRPPEKQTATESSAPPELPDDVQTREFVPGELEQGTISRTFDQFSAGRTDVKLATEDKAD